MRWQLIVLAIAVNIVVWGLIIWAVMTFVMPHFTFWKP